MGDRLLVDVNLLTETGSQLTSIVNEFEGADAYAESVADAVGDDGLANAVRDFSTKWKIRREDMRGAIEIMNFMGRGEAAHAYQALRNVDNVSQFAKNATGYVGTMGRLGSLNPAKVGGIGSALVPYAADVGANSTLLYRDSRTW